MSAPGAYRIGTRKTPEHGVYARQAENHGPAAFCGAVFPGRIGRACRRGMPVCMQGKKAGSRRRPGDTPSFFAQRTDAPGRNRWAGQLFLFPSRVSLVKKGKMADVRFARRNLVEGASLSRAYAVLYNYGKMLRETHSLCQKAREMGLEIDTEKILVLYLFGDGGQRRKI